MHSVSGIIFLDKPLGWTSRQAVNEVSRLFSRPGRKKIKAGHAGTLDPLATGMLPILLGDATRFAEMGLSAEKTYEVSFDLSFQTDTLDREGETIATFDGAVSRDQLEAALDEFRGEIEQVPPIYSAIRVDGKRGYDMARKGQQVSMKARSVRIDALKLLAFDYPLVTLEVSCSKGTYIRSLARDIGEKLGAGGCVTELRRLSTGGWDAAMMVSMDELREKQEQCLLPVGQWLRDFERLQLQGDEIKRFLQGQRLQLKNRAADTETKSVAVFAEDMLLGTGSLKAGQRHMVLHPVRILPSAQARYL